MAVPGWPVRPADVEVPGERGEDGEQGRSGEQHPGDLAGGGVGAGQASFGGDQVTDRVDPDEGPQPAGVPAAWLTVLSRAGLAVAFASAARIAWDSYGRRYRQRIPAMAA